MPSTKDLAPSVAQLAAHRFSARQVIDATGITGDMLTNILTKVKPILCSDSAGRGKARQYCLIDVYQIALLARLTRLTGKANWSGRSIEYLVMVGVSTSAQSEPLVHGSRLESRRDELCNDIGSAHELFWTRSFHTKPWFLFAELAYVTAGLFGVKVVDATTMGRLINEEEGFYLNATSVLTDVDRRLLQSLEGEEA